jgi:hypothetical protein
VQQEGLGLTKYKRGIAIVALVSLLPLVLSGFFFPIQLVNASPPNWSSPTLVDAHAGVNELSSALQAANGTLWVAWGSDRNAQGVRTDVIIKTYTNGAWSKVDQNATTNGQNLSPNLIQLSNGTIGMFWSREVGTSYDIFYTSYQPSGWSSPVQMTSTSYNDTSPSAAVGRDGTIWLVWTRINSTSTTNPAIKQLYYKTWKSGSWSPEMQLTTDSNQNYAGNVMVSKDGIVRVTFSKGVAGSTYQLYEKTYNGTVWTPDTQIVSSSSTDDHPSLIQDRNGTLWLFWARLIVVSLTLQYYELWGQYSYNLGATWSSQVQLTPTPGTTAFDSFQPAAVQSAYGTKPIYVFYTSNYNEPNYDIYSIQSTGISPVHDVKVTGLSTSNTLGTSWEYPGGLKSVGQSAIVTITVTISNSGDYAETVTATLTATNMTNITIGTKSNVVGPGYSMNFYYYWNTTNVKPARYGLSVSITPLSGETFGNMGDNSYSKPNQVHIIPLGDVDQDGSVTISDISVFYYGYGFGSSCNCSRWNPYADINNNGVIDIVDLSVASVNYGKFT